MKNLSLRQRLWTAFGAVIVLVCALGGIGWWLKSAIYAQFERVVALQHKVELIAELESDAIHNARVGAAMITASGDQLARLTTDRKQHSARIDELLGALDRAIVLPEGKRLLGDIERARGVFLAAQDQALTVAGGGDLQTATQMRDTTIETAWQRYEQSLNALRVFENSVVEDASRAVELVSRKGEIAILTMTALALAIAIGSATVFARSLFSLLGGEPAEAARVVQRIAAGDLREPIQVPAGGEASLLGQMERMRLQLNEVLHQLGTHANVLTQHAEALASASQQAAGAASQESDAAARMAATVEEMTVSIAHVSDNAGSTSDTAQQTGTLARQGSEVILGLTDGMASISRHVRDSADSVAALNRESEQIRSVVVVIQEIAEQTNLLALNAAIEAARAGESGRGFAVVADEVRKLAERTAMSTRDIAAMIQAIQSNVSRVVVAMERSIEEVGEGEALAGRAGKAMHAIELATQDVVKRVADISGATRENSSASNDVARTVEQIAQLSEENSGAAQQLSGTARTLNEVALTIHGLTSRFRTA